MVAMVVVVLMVVVVVVVETVDVRGGIVVEIVAVVW